MNMSNKVVPAVLAFTLASTPLIADTEFGEDMPSEVVEQLVGSAFGGEPKLYSDIFADFPSFTLPAGFDVLASADQGVQQRVILRTSLDAAEARDPVVAALMAEGWMQMPVYGEGAPRTGFVSTNTPTMQPLQLCNDALGRMSVMVSDGGNGRYVNLARTTLAAFGGSRRSCAEEAEMITRGPGSPFRGGADGVNQYLPALVMPASDVATGRQPAIFSSGGGGGSSNDFETRGFLAITWEGAALLTHFAEQIEDQGWQPDTQTSSAQTAFGSWTKTVDGNALLGMLTLVETGVDSWDLKFRIVRAGSGAPANIVVDEVVR